MIDEDLYQLAADELNTDKRRPHIWARACALASDDHDEARYLYTNLRVEELIAEREAGGGAAAAVAGTGPDSADDSLALEPLDFDEDSPQSISTPSGLDQNNGLDTDALSLDSASDAEDLPDFEATRSRNFEEGFDSGSSSELEHPGDDLELGDDFLDETINLTSELDGTAVFELDKADADDTLSGDNAKDISADAELEALLGGVYEAGAPVDTGADDSEAAMTADFSDVSGAHDALDDDLAWLDDDARESDSNASADTQLQTVSGDADDILTLDDIRDTDRLALELERQAGELPGQPSDVVAVSEQTPIESSNASDEEQLALVLDDPPTDAGSADSTGSSGLDSIFDSIEHEADEAASRLGGNSESSDVDTAAPSPYETDAGDDAQLDAADLSEDVKTGKEPDIDFGSDDMLPAAAMTAVAGTVAGTVSGTVAGTAAGSAAGTTSGTRSGTSTADSTVAGAVQAPDISPPSSARAAPIVDHASSDSQPRTVALPLDLTDERSSGSRYSVFRRDTQTQAVKQGASWSALFLTLPFLLYRHLFGTAVVYTIMWLILVGGLLVSGLAWLDAGPAASVAIKASTIGFAVLAFIGLLYLPFRHANQWREARLEQRGFEQVALVRDSSPGKAISQARNAAVLN